MLDLNGSFRDMYTLCRAGRLGGHLSTTISMAARQRLRSLNPFRPVTRVINRAPFEIIFMVSHIHMPPEGNFIHPLHLTLRKTLRSNEEIDFDPLIFDRGHAPPQYIFVVDANDAGNLNAPYLALSRNLLMNNARVTIGLNRAQRQLFAEGQQGTPFQRAR